MTAWIRNATALSAAVLGLVGCGEPWGAVCEPGASRACSCGPGAALEEQRCEPSGDGWEPCPCPAADGDADSDADSDADDAEADVDEDDLVEWDPLAGCTGADGDERWLVAAPSGGVAHGYLTGRDCAEPRELCVGCYPASISPSGAAVLALEPAGDLWRLDDEIIVISLDGDPPTTTRLGISGALPVWDDDDSFFYVAAPTGVSPCEGDSDRPELTEHRRHVISTGEDELVADDFSRGWRVGFPAASPERPRLAVGHDISTACSQHHLAVTILDLETDVVTHVEWTLNSDDDGSVGVLPDGSGFLVQHWDHDSSTARLYAVSFDGQSLPVARDLDARDQRWLVARLVRGSWLSCGTARHIGPACEVYCSTQDGEDLYRHHLEGGEPELIECPALGDDFRIMDVQQR